MKAYTYIEKGKFALTDKPRPTIQEPTDAIVRVTLGSICSSDLHIKHGSVPRAVPGITVGHEMVGVVEETGAGVRGVKVGDRVTVNVETFCGECFFCKHGYVNNCTSPHGGWALGCRIDGGQTEYVRVPLASQGLNRIPDSVTDEQALLVGAKDTFRLAWRCARPNAIVTIVALYDEPQVLPLPDMYGKNLTFKTGGVDGCDCEETLRLIAQGKIDTTPLITHRFPLAEIEKAYRLFENREDGVIKVAIYNE